MENDSYIHNNHLLCNEQSFSMRLTIPHCQNLSSAPSNDRIEKKKDSIWHILAPSLIGMFLCIVCLCGTTWAWYTASKSSNVASVKTADYTVNIGINDTLNTQSNEATDIQLLDGKSIYTASLYANRTYVFCLRPAGKATTGFCKIIFEGTEYYTEQIAKDSSISFTVNTSKDGDMQIECFWGTCAVQDITKIGDGSIIGVPVSQEVQSVANDDPAVDQGDMQENDDAEPEEQNIESVEQENVIQLEEGIENEQTPVTES